MRLAFFGSGNFARPTLETLLARNHDLAAVVTQPERPAGRGGKPRPTPIGDLAAERGLRLLTPERPDAAEFVETIRGLDLDLAVVVAYGHLLRKQLLALPRLGFVNLHASLLPAYRGAAPVPWALLNGERESGVTVFRLNERFDEGAILARRALPIAPDDNTGTYLAKLAPIGAALMAEAAEDLAAGRATPCEQDETAASRAPKLTKQDGEIDWNLPFAAIERRVRAFQPWPLAWTILATNRGPLRVSVLRLLPCDASNAAADADADAAATTAAAATPGSVLRADAGGGLVIRAGDAPVRLAEVLPEGKRAMTDNEFLRGTGVMRG